MVGGLIINPGANAGARAALEIYFEPAMIISARKVDKLGLMIRSFREPLKRSLQRVVIPSIKANFAAGGRPRWTALAERTVNNRGTAEPILIRSGALSKVMGQLNIWTIDIEKAFIKDLPGSVWYGKVHQAGLEGTRSESAAEFKGSLNIGLGKRGGRIKRSDYGTAGQKMANDNTGSAGIPQRQFVMLQPGDEEKIHLVFQEWLDERILAAGLR